MGAYRTNGQPAQSGRPASGGRSEPGWPGAAEATIGIIANPMSGRDIRRLVARASAHNQRHSSTLLALPHQSTPHTSPSVVPLPSPRTIQIQDTTAVRRGAASRAVLGSCSGAAARAAVQVWSPRSRYGWPSATRRCDRGEVWLPSGWSPVARMSGRRPRRSSPCPRPLSAVRTSVSNRSSGRPVSTRPVSRRPVPCRCPDGRVSGVRGSAAALSGPRWPVEWLGAAGHPRWGNGFDVSPWSAGGVVACPHGV
jgi:hypothetical protein